MRTRPNSMAYRSAIGVALAAAFILVWLSLGVGVIGKDGDPARCGTQAAVAAYVSQSTEEPLAA